MSSVRVVFRLALGVEDAMRELPGDHQFQNLLVSGRRSLAIFAFLALSLIIAGCGGDDSGAATPRPAPSPTSTLAIEDAGGAGEVVEDISFITVATDAPSRFQDFGDVDPFGNVVGFDPEVMARLAEAGGFNYEFVVTRFNGLLESVANGEFSTAMSALEIPELPQEGLVYTDPYLKVGQVLVVRANESELLDYHSVVAGIPIGAQQFRGGEHVARTILGLSEPDLQLYPDPPQALQALIDRQVEGVILDSDDAAEYTANYPQQLKIAGGGGEEAWISERAYGIAVPEEDQVLLALLNEAIGQAAADGSLEQLTKQWLVANQPIDAGESLVGTPDDELVIGIAEELISLDPANRQPDLVSWEVQRNIMSGLLGYDAQNNLIPVLATDLPLISEDRLEYTFSLRPGLTFSDGRELTAEDVRFSINRAAGLGNFQVNRYLKDANEDNFADADAVQVVDPLTVKFVLQEPTSYFPSVLATPPFSVLSQECLNSGGDAGVACGGIGPYLVAEFESGVQVRLTANETWPGQPPSFEKVQLRFYDDPGRMRRSLENNAIDLAWTGAAPVDIRELRSDPSFESWETASAFKSYLVFEQSEAPWSSARLREAIAYAVDREALANDVFDGFRKPLTSPVPADTPGHLPTQPARDLESARSILIASGYSQANPLEMTIWYVNDGRYTALEEQYATALKAQLEETELIAVTLEGAPWEIFRPSSVDCSYPAYLLGWPSSGQPAAYLDAMSWIEYFITNTDRICSNFENTAMENLYQEALQEVDEGQRLALYGQIQELWAREFPTLDLTQQPRVAVSVPTVDGVWTDAMGLMHYDLLVKNGG
ncbi:MAG: transporter substrate-binding domain-containing protein [Chloroflexota bacterium]|nr:MAG: transporter substrate-binding domain-containing protein [Chloroflexota bacterium]